jgi:hypothetical protein
MKDRESGNFLWEVMSASFAELLQKRSDAMRIKSFLFAS